MERTTPGRRWERASGRRSVALWTLFFMMMSGYNIRVCGAMSRTKDHRTPRASTRKRLSSGTYVMTSRARRRMSVNGMTDRTTVKTGVWNRRLEMKQIEADRRGQVPDLQVGQENDPEVHRIDPVRTGDRDDQRHHHDDGRARYPSSCRRRSGTGSGPRGTTPDC